MILADTSCWVSFLRNDKRAQHVERTLDRAEWSSTEPVLMEILSGARSVQDADRLRAMLHDGVWLMVDPATDFEAAATIYVTARSRGITPDSHMDCLILAVASRNNAALFTFDQRQADIAKIIGVPVI